jgi:hypothetical protein
VVGGNPAGMMDGGSATTQMQVVKDIKNSSFYGRGRLNLQQQPISKVPVV